MTLPWKVQMELAHATDGTPVLCVRIRLEPNADLAPADYARGLLYDLLDVVDRAFPTNEAKEQN